LFMQQLQPLVANAKLERPLDSHPPLSRELMLTRLVSDDWGEAHESAQYDDNYGQEYQDQAENGFQSEEQHLGQQEHYQEHSEHSEQHQDHEEHYQDHEEHHQDHEEQHQEHYQEHYQEHCQNGDEHGESEDDQQDE
jgi:hypothetical protein